MKDLLWDVDQILNSIKSETKTLSLENLNLYVVYLKKIKNKKSLYITSPNLTTSHNSKYFLKWESVSHSNCQSFV